MAIPKYTYSDIIRPDDSINNLILQLTQASEKIEQVASTVVKSANSMKGALQGTNSASAEGREQIAQTAARVDKLSAEYEKLRQAQSNLGIEVQKYKGYQREQNKLTKLSLQLNESAEGSYNKLAAQYALLKNRINAMSKAQRENSAAGKAMVNRSREIYTEMQRLQEATGKHTLSVGNYAKATYGLNTAFNQVTRELPVLGMNLNTFFLAISNNIPMLVDEISRLKVANKEALDQGKMTIPVGKSIVKAILSWQTALSVGVALLTIYGKDMVEFIGSMIKGAKAVDTQAAAVKALNQAMDDGSVSAREELVELELLYRASQDDTRSRKERLDAVDQMRDAWPEHLENLTDEEILVGKGAEAYDSLSESILRTARARAAQDLIVEKYRELYEEQVKLVEKTEKLVNRRVNMGGALGGLLGAFTSASMKNVTGNIQELEASIDALMDSIDVEDLFGGDSGNKKAGKAVDETLNLMRKATDTMIELTQDAELREIQQTRTKYERQIDDYRFKLATDQNLTEKGRESINEIIVNLEQIQTDRLEEIRQKYDDKRRKAREKEILNNAKALKRQYNDVVEYYNQEYDLELSRIDLMEVTEAEKTDLRIQAEIDRWDKILALNKTKAGQLSNLQIEAIKNTIEKLKREMGGDGDSEPKSIYDLLGLSLDGDQEDALSEAMDLAVDYLDEFLDKRLEISEKLIDAAQRESDAAREAVASEIEARNQGYAYNVSDARRRLQLAEQTEREALKRKEGLLKQQEALQAIDQAGNLITATSEIWAAFAGFPPAAIAATALMSLMWGSFVAAKVKAFQATSQTYGEGGLEILEGGSHSSGNDIPLGFTRDGRSRRAEGGEAMAIVNKQQTKKYRRMLPALIDSLNKGTFEEQYLGAYDTGGVSINTVSNSADLKRLEGDVQAIRRQGERTFYTDSKGRKIEKYKNLTRITNVN